MSVIQNFLFTFETMRGEACCIPSAQHMRLCVTIRLPISTKWFPNVHKTFTFVEINRD